MPVRTIQGMIASLVRRAGLKRIAVTANTLRHTFALGFLRDNPGQLVELAELLGHESRHMVSLYARSSGDALAAYSEHRSRNAAG
jgi:site-specific recombinase XerD